MVITLYFWQAGFKDKNERQKQRGHGRIENRENKLQKCIKPIYQLSNFKFFLANFLWAYLF